MRKNGIVIAIDGPAGVGKSSVGKLVAQKIDYKFISSGKMYRAVAWLCIKKNINLQNEDEVLSLAKSYPIKFIDNSTIEPSLTIDGHILETELYDEEIAKATSSIAKLKELRKHLVIIQREIGKDGGIIMEGRDITTNVFPDAELKIYLDASPQARAKRRFFQLEANNIKADYNEILDMIIKRDLQDKTRQHNPLKKSSDSIYLDSTNLSKDEVVSKIIELYQNIVFPK